MQRLTTYVDVDTGASFEMTSVRCALEDPSQTSNISVGQEITVDGDFNEWDGMNVLLNPCSVKND